VSAGISRERRSASSCVGAVMLSVMRLRRNVSKASSKNRGQSYTNMMEEMRRLGENGCAGGDLLSFRCGRFRIRREEEVAIEEITQKVT
jgi:hypothetical protein